MKRKQIVIMGVDPEFRNMIKSESAKKGESIIDFTRRLARNKSLIDEYEETANEKKRFVFKI